jgi:hypothetical protein
MPFDDLDLTLVSNSVLLGQIHSLTLEGPDLYDQVRSVAELLRDCLLCLRVIRAGFHLSKAAPSQAYKRPFTERPSRGNHLL